MRPTHIREFIMRKLFTLLLAVLTSTATLFAWDYEHVQIGDLYYNLDATNNTAEVTYESYDAYNYQSLTAVTIPATIVYDNVQYSVTTIGQCAFYGAYTITEINLSYAISNITPFDVTEEGIGYAEFKRSNLTTINVDSNNPCYSSVDGVLFDKSGQTLVGFPCGKEGEYTVPQGVTSIAQLAFMGAFSIKEVNLPESVTSIGIAAFAYCLNLREVNLPSSITEISESAFAACYLLQDIEIPSGIKKIGAGAFEACLSILSIDIPQGVDTIDLYAFGGIPHINYAGSATGAPWYASYMNKYVEDGIVYADQSQREILAAARNRDTIVIPASVETIGYQAIFMNDYKSFMGSLGDILDLDGIAFGASMVICHATNVPNVGREFIIHSGESINGTLYVPAESIELYKAADGWNKFKNICAFGAMPTTIADNSVVVTPAATSAQLTWPTVNEAAYYEIVITDTDGNVVGSLTFNSKGEMTGKHFAPAKNVETNAFVYNVTGLEENTTYNYMITAKDEEGNVLDTKSGSFVTNGGSEGFDEVQLNSECTKILRDGQIFILRGDKTYTVTGQEVK